MKSCLIFDIDGTLANCGHRVHHVNGHRKNWPAFFAGIPDDEPIEQVTWLNRVLANFVSPTWPIFLCSGRSEDERDITETWLKNNSVRYDQMFMRKSKDYRADHIVKRELLEEIRAKGYEPFIIFDDRQSVVDMWRKEGLFVLQCDPTPSYTDHERGFKFHKSMEYPLTIMVGPSGAGKSTWINEQSAEPTWKQSIISSDVIRESICGDFRDQSQNDAVFEAFHSLAKERLRRGLPVVLDATHLRNQDRIKSAKLVPPTVPVRYVVINRPIAEKMKTAGWRSSVMVKGKPLIQRHDEVFNCNIKDILNGDALPNVTVEDYRK